MSSAEPSEIKPVAAVKPQPSRPSVAWSNDFAGTEHPDTARIRVQKDYVATLTALKRESIDETYRYLNELIDKAKDEMGHARSSSNDLRRAMLQQHVDEVIAYVEGYGITPKLPTRYGDAKTESLANFFVIDEIPAFLGQTKFLIDLWYQKGLAKVHDEVASLIGLNRPPAPQRTNAANS